MGKVIQKELYMCDNCGKQGESWEVKSINISFDGIGRLENKHLCLTYAKEFGLHSHMNGMFYIIDYLKKTLNSLKKWWNKEAFNI